MSAVHLFVPALRAAGAACRQRWNRRRTAPRVIPVAKLLPGTKIESRSGLKDCICLYQSSSPSRTLMPTKAGKLSTKRAKVGRLKHAFCVRRVIEHEPNWDRPRR